MAFAGSSRDDLVKRRNQTRGGSREELTMEPQRDDPEPDRRTEIEALHQTAARLERAGLVVDRTSLSRAHRRALFALQCQLVDRSEPTAPGPALIGFAYPSSQRGESARRHGDEAGSDVELTSDIVRSSSD
jgi:hypothetical protein